MTRIFNTNGYCDPELNYMVDLTGRLMRIRAMVDAEKYFVIHRARQYGKTTTLIALADYLRKDYNVISLDFQGISHADFGSEQRFVAAFSRQMLMCADDISADDISAEVRAELDWYATGKAEEATLSLLFISLQKLCQTAKKRIVLIIDEVDSAADNQIFLDFLAQLRFYYLKRKRTPTFQSVILAGVYDIRNMKRKLRPDDEHKQNSPWNIAADFDVDMSFSPEDISGMLKEYEEDYHTGMDVTAISGLLYEYTSGYPVLVSGLCKIMDEKLAGRERFESRRAVWTGEGVREAVRLLLSEKNMLFESLIGKLNDYPGLGQMIFQLLFCGQSIIYNADDPAIDMLFMFGFIRIENGMVQIANRIFETRLYNYFLTLPAAQKDDMYALALRTRNQDDKGRNP